ncbi:ATP-binding cassette domain-containing protein, partial [Bacillus sp. SS-TM]
MIELKNVSKVYKNAEETAVKGVSVHIKKGEFFVLVGPSGCGKSTLLRMIAGLEETAVKGVSVHIKKGEFFVLVSSAGLILARGVYATMVPGTIF